MFNIFSRRKSAPEPLFFSTDIHCHLVPGIDDGSPDVETSVELIRSMNSWGIRRIIATPHVTEEVFENSVSTIAPPLAQLKEALQRAGINVDIDHSAEYRLDDLFKKQFAAGECKPYPNDYLLVENSWIQEPWGLDETLFDIKVKRMSPILAHPERYTYYFDNRERLKKIHDDGTLFQVNLLSLAGHYGKDQRRQAEWLIENDLVDFLGSDLHNASHVESIERYLASKDYRRDRERLEGRILNDRAFK
ncbi:MAG: hypothetical protein K2L81_01540 [Muribaculaceae bacterium]|nr:hypothetical protein [Muribaculaceae bacterium]